MCDIIITANLKPYLKLYYGCETELAIASTITDTGKRISMRAGDAFNSA
jgi:hypothetical protein